MVNLARTYMLNQMDWTFEVDGKEITFTYDELKFWDLDAAAAELSSICTSYTNINGDWDEEVAEEDEDGFEHETTAAHILEQLQDLVNYELSANIYAEIKIALANKAAQTEQPALTEVTGAVMLEIALEGSDKDTRDQLKAIGDLCKSLGGVPSVERAQGLIPKVFAFDDVRSALQARLTDTRLLDVTASIQNGKEMMKLFDEGRIEDAFKMLVI